MTITNFQSASEGDYRVVVSNFAGSVASVPATVLLDSPLRMGALGMNGNGQFQLRLIGQGGTNYVLQASSNLTNWVSLVTNAAPSGIWDFLDASGSNFQLSLLQGDAESIASFSVGQEFHRSRGNYPG